MEEIIMDMEAIIKAIQNTQTPKLLIVVGLFILVLAFLTKIGGSSVCVMQWTGVIRDETLIETDITAIFVNCLQSGAN